MKKKQIRSERAVFYKPSLKCNIVLVVRGKLISVRYLDMRQPRSNLRVNHLLGCIFFSMVSFSNLQVVGIIFKITSTRIFDH